MESPLPSERPPLVCTNCGREVRPWLHLVLLAITHDPFSSEKDPSWRCGRCRPRRDVGLRLSCRVVRDKYGVSQRCWSRLLGVNLRTVVRWECGTPSPNGRALETLAALDCAVDLNPGVVSIVRAHVRDRKTHAELVAGLLIRAAGGVLRPKRTRRAQPRVGEPLVEVRVKMTQGERAQLAYVALRQGRTLAQWLRERGIVHASVGLNAGLTSSVAVRERLGREAARSHARRADTSPR